MHRHPYISFSIFLISAIISSCGWNDTNEYAEVVEGDDEMETSQGSGYGSFKDYELRKIGATSFEVNDDHPSKIAEWSIKNGFRWISGFEYRDRGELYVYLDKHGNGINMKMSFYLPEREEFPTVYDHDFGKNDEADYLMADIVIRNDQNGKKIKLSERSSISSSSWSATGIEFALDLTDLHAVPAGAMSFTVEISTVFESFFGVRSKEKPVTASINFQYDMPKLYHTDIYFKKLVLNKESVRRKLGSGNDFNNPDPETGIRIVYNGSSVLFDYSKNSFSLHSRKKARFYHLSKDDQVRIDIEDVDYGFNGSDGINDTTVFLRDLESKDYINLPMKYVEELLIYAKFGGKANFD